MITLAQPLTMLALPRRTLADVFGASLALSRAIVLIREQIS
ncbi:MAG: hypothetical protein ACO25D_08295 [Burkholderiaceae bacterium]|jgi:hypothetical protein